MQESKGSWRSMLKDRGIVLSKSEVKAVNQEKNGSDKLTKSISSTGPAKMIRRGKIILTFLLVVCMSVCFAACGDDDTSSSTSDGKDKVEYTEVSHLDFPINNIRTLNPSISKDEDTYFISRLIYDGLFRIDKNMTPQPDLAKSYKFNKDSGTVTIDLIDTEFHDGKALTANDVKFTIEAYKAAGSECRYSHLMSKISYAENVKKKRVRIHFNNKNDMSLGMLTFPVLPAHRYEGVYSLISSKGGFKPVGTGQYRYRSFKDKKDLKLKPNTEYHADKALNTLTFTVVTNSSAAYQLVEASSLSALITRSPERQAKVANEDQKIVDFVGNEFEFVGFNFNRDTTYDRNVRKAIAYSIDTEALIEEVAMNSGVQSDTIFYPGYLGTEKKKDQFGYDPDKAAKFFARGGLKDRNSDGLLDSDSGVTLNLQILVNSDNKLRRELADSIKSSLSDAGVNSYITALPEKSYKSYLRNGDFDIFVGGMTFDEAFDLRTLLHGEEQPQNSGTYTNGYNSSANSQNSQQNSVKDGDEDLDEDVDTTAERKRKEQNEVKKLLSRKPDNNNYSRYYNPKMNSALSRMMSGATVEEMTKELNKAKALLTEDLPYYCLMYRTYGAVQSPSMEGKMSPLFDNYYNGIGSLKCRFEKTAGEK